MDHVIRGVNSLMSLYMLLILLRWVGPWLELDFRHGRLRWIPALTDPLIVPIRRILPPMGPLDFGPLATLFALWIVRTFIVAVLIASQHPSSTAIPG
ncbi:MAG: YggT family protein [Candidatus Hydrogenedentes bacterium]|nr:YggT family protein [Candidatus Hydrogenedentota bacterium]